MSVENNNEKIKSQTELASEQKERFKKGLSIDDLLAGQQESVLKVTSINESFYKDMFESPKFITLIECLNKPENIGNTCNILNEHFSNIQQTA